MKKKLNILILEDNDEDFELIVREITRNKLSFNLKRAISEKDFKSYLSSSDHDIILADYSIPGFDGMQALEIALRQKTNIPFIFVTGTLGEEKAVETIKKGATDVVLKSNLFSLGLKVKRAVKEAEDQKEKIAVYHKLETKSRQLKKRIKELNCLYEISRTVHHSNDNFHTALPKIADLLRKACQSPAKTAVKITFKEHTIQSSGPRVSQQKMEVPFFSNKKKVGRIEVFKPSSNETIFEDKDGRLIREVANKIENAFNQLEQKRELRESEIRYRSFFENSLDGLMIGKPDGSVLHANPAACSVLGYTEEELKKLGREGITIKNKLLTEGLLKKRKTKMFRGELLFKRKNGDVFPAQVTSNIFINKEGEENTSVIIKDISKTKEAEKKLKRSEERLQLALKAADIGMWNQNIKTGNVIVDKQIYTILGYSRDELPSDIASLGQLVHAKDIQKTRAAFATHLNGESPLFLSTFRMRAKSGKWKWINARGKVVKYDNNGNPVRITGTYLDITKQRISESQLAERNKELETFIYRTTHDLKSPVSSIKGILLLTRKEVIENKTITLYLEKIDQSANNLERVLHSVSQIAPILQGNIKPEKINIYNSINKVITNYSFYPNAADFSFVINVESNENFLTDKKLLEIILGNILENAFKFHAKITLKPIIKVIGKQLKNKLRLKIYDNGIGIAEEQQDMVFDMFYRGSEYSEGPGLGLYMVKKAVEKLGGSITLNSKLKKGTIFNIEIPELENRKFG